MASSKISDLTALSTTPASGDLFVIVDISDDTMASTGTDKKLAFSVLDAVWASQGANSDITSLSGLTTPLSVAQGGTGRATLTSATILAGNGTSAVSLYTTTGSGTVVALATSPNLTTPVLGAATATSINGLTITTTTGTLTLANSSSLITSGGNSLTLITSGTTAMTFPAATDTVAVLGTAQTYTATQTEKQVVWTNNAIAASSNAATVPITHRLHTVTNSSAATLTITMTTTSAVDGQLVMVRILDFSGVAQTITWVNTENSTVTAPVTSNGSTTLFLTVGFIYNGATSKWRCIASS